MFNVGIYISGIILISSFLIKPESIDINSLRKICFIVIILSIIMKEINKYLEIWLNNCKDDEIIICEPNKQQKEILEKLDILMPKKLGI